MQRLEAPAAARGAPCWRQNACSEAFRRQASLSHNGRPSLPKHSPDRNPAPVSSRPDTHRPSRRGRDPRVPFHDFTGYHRRPRRSGGMADTGDSKSPARKGMRVRIPPPAPVLKTRSRSGPRATDSASTDATGPVEATPGMGLLRVGGSGIGLPGLTGPSDWSGVTPTSAGTTGRRYLPLVEAPHVTALPDALAISPLVGQPREPALRAGRISVP